MVLTDRIVDALNKKYAQVGTSLRKFAQVSAPCLPRCSMLRNVAQGYVVNALLTMQTLRDFHKKKVKSKTSKMKRAALGHKNKANHLITNQGKYLKP